MTENNKIVNFTDALSVLDEISQNFLVDVYVPSLNKTIQFKEIDAKQQKDLLGAAMNTSIYNSIFNSVFYDILKQNIIANVPEKELLNFNIFDKICIGLHLKNQISNTINVKFDDEKNISDTFNIQDIINKFKDYKAPKSESFEIKNEKYSLKVEIAIPNIKKEVDFDNDFKKSQKTDNLKTNEEIQTVVTNAFITEITKFINNIWINGNEFVFDETVPYDEKIKIVEKIPSSLLQKVLECISAWKKDVDNILTVKSGEYSKAISFDSMLFLN